MGVKVKQRDITDCGAACLASVAAHYELNMPVSRIRQLAGTDKKGTNVLGMLEAAHKMGFEAKGVKGTYDSLFKIPLPAIAHMVVKEVLHHYVVIQKINKKHIVIMDPADGEIHIKTHEDFKKEWTGVLILLLPDDGFVTRNEKQSVNDRFWNLLKPHKAILFQALLGALVYTVLGLSTSIYVQKIVDFVLVDGNRNLLNLLSVGMLLILIFQLFIGTVKTLFTIRTGQLIDAKLILGYYKHLLKLPQQFFDQMRVGEIISRINDAVKIRAFLNDVSLNFLVNLFVILFSFGLMFTYYWKLALLMLIIIPMYTLVYFVVNKMNKTVQRRLMEDVAELESQLVESLNSIGTIKRFGIETFANQKTEVKFIKLLETVYRSNVNSLFAGTSTELISRVFTILLLWIGAAYVLANQITPGELLSFYALIGYFTGPVSALITMDKTIQDARIAADRLFEIMDLAQEEGHTKQIDLNADKTGNIRFQDVSFRYGTRVNVFEHLNLEIEKGKFTAVVGESGSGKSTLMSILQNIYPIQGGAIFIGEYDLKYISNSSLRKHVAVVPQQIDLFAGNVIDNIALGDDEPDMERILQITRYLGLIPFIESLPQGFETYLGENGASLSGGQKQRLAIARALYRNPEILILDEATSSLDVKSELFVQNLIAQLKREGKTIIFISHRLQTVLHADHIVVLENGCVKESGTHEDLIRLKDTYYKLWQAGGLSVA